MTPALDQADRNQALLAWAGILCGGPIVPVIILVLNWTKPQSLARQQALTASIMWGVVLIAYVPLVARMAVQGGPDSIFWIAWGVIVPVTLVVTIVQAVRVLRTPAAAAS